SPIITRIYYHDFAVVVFSHHFLINTSERPITHPWNMYITQLTFAEAIYFILVLFYPSFVKQQVFRLLGDGFYSYRFSSSFWRSHFQGSEPICLPVQVFRPIGVGGAFRSVTLLHHRPCCYVRSSLIQWSARQNFANKHSVGLMAVIDKYAQR